MQASRAVLPPHANALAADPEVIDARLDTRPLPVHLASATVNALRAGVPQVPSGPDGETSRRLLCVDAARGVALLGMMAVHALVSSDASGNPTVVHSLSAGRSAALFAVLAGVGIAFLTRRRRVALGPDARRAGG